MERKKRRGDLVSSHFYRRKGKTMKMWIILLASLLLCVSILSCGGDNKSHWACNCEPGTKTTIVCADNSGDATNQALAQICSGVEGCGCDCLDTHVEQGC
jgi:hypothetical protein